MRYVPYYQRNAYYIGNVTFEPKIGVVEVPDSAESIWSVASEIWLQNNVPVCEGVAFASEAEAIKSGRAEVRTYWESKCPQRGDGEVVQWADSCSALHGDSDV